MAQRCPWDWFVAHLGCSWPKIFEEYQKERGISLDAVLGLQEFNRAYRDAIDTLCEIEIVADVARRHFGRVPMAVASGGTGEIVEVTLLATNLLDLFEAIVTIEDVQGRGKPAPDMFLEAARRLRVPPNECTVFEDSDEGIEAARRAGMSATDVRSVYWPAWRFGLQRDRGKPWEPSMSIVIRAMAPADISAARMLLLQLGYEMSTNEVERRYSAVRERGTAHGFGVSARPGFRLHSAPAERTIAGGDVVRSPSRRCPRDSLCLSDMQQDVPDARHCRRQGEQLPILRLALAGAIDDGEDGSR